VAARPRASWATRCRASRSANAFHGEEKRRAAPGTAAGEGCVVGRGPLLALQGGGSRRIREDAFRDLGGGRRPRVVRTPGGDLERSRLGALFISRGVIQQPSTSDSERGKASNGRHCSSSVRSGKSRRLGNNLAAEMILLDQGQLGVCSNIEGPARKRPSGPPSCWRHSRRSDVRGGLRLHAVFIPSPMGGEGRGRRSRSSRGRTGTGLAGEARTTSGRVVAFHPGSRTSTGCIEWASLG